MISALSLLKTFAREVFSLANDPDANIRAATMDALGHVADPTSRRILERAAAQEAPLVAAAAIDALERVGSQRREQLLTPLIDHEDFRVRSAALLVLHRVVLRRARGGPKYCPYDLFRDSLKRLGVGWLDRVILTRVALHARLQQPVEILLSPEHLDRQCADWSRDLSPSLARKARSRIAALKHKLFEN